jgi:hypothetical protein
MAANMQLPKTENTAINPNEMESAVSDQSASNSLSHKIGKSLKGVRWWLILIIFGLPFQFLIIWGDIESFFKQASWYEIVPNTKAIAWASLAHDALMICLGLALVVFLFRKKRFVPKLMASWFSLIVIGKMVVAIINGYYLGIYKRLNLEPLYDKLDSRTTMVNLPDGYFTSLSLPDPLYSLCTLHAWASELNMVIVTTLVIASMMISCFFMSKRVKATFVR